MLLTSSQTLSQLYCAGTHGTAKLKHFKTTQNYGKKQGSNFRLDTSGLDSSPVTELFVLKAKLGLDLTFFNEGQATVVRRPNIFQEKNMTHHDEIRPSSKSLDLIYKPFKKVNCHLFNLLYFLSK